MKTHIIIGTLVLALVLLAGTLISTNKEVIATNTSTSAITLENSSYDFGTIDIFGGLVKANFTLKNTGTEDVQVLSAETSCMCTTGEIDGLVFGMHGSNNKQVTIPAGETKTLVAVYDPLAHGPNGTGKISRELIITTNSTETPTLRALLSANVIKEK